jgi:hypothetical protein
LTIETQFAKKPIWRGRRDMANGCSRMDFVPFDLIALRCICYEFTPRGTQQLEKELFGTIQTLMKAG